MTAEENETKQVEQAALRELAAELGSHRVRFGEPLAPYTTFKIGGPADLFYRAESLKDLERAVRLARSFGVPYFVLGLGANILVGDRGIRGLVIKNDASKVKFHDGDSVVAESGAIMSDLIQRCLELELSGLEHFVGIPSTVGGALWQNLHFLSPDRTRTVYIEEALESALILSERGNVEEVGKDYFQFGYDDSILHHRRDVVLSARFRLKRGSRYAIRDVVERNLAWRRAKHPDLEQFPSAGSVFRKLEGLGAGRLIEQCGLKGMTIGRAQVSEKHANFIVNLGGATARDVVDLIHLCKARVRERFGVELVEEIRLVGEF